MTRLKTWAVFSFSFGMMGLPMAWILFRNQYWTWGTGVFVAGAGLMFIALTTYGTVDSMEFAKEQKQ